MGKKNHKKKKTASGKKQSISNQELECFRKETEVSIIESLTKKLNKAIDSVSHTLRE